ncbi:hypothetical protein GP2143_13246 [marine gamma proteobacterium HTCC2143]|uniref:Uncharacterized protein n=1 Tax=marine gamma proteobacterium HTCC2143 TaxID=247633 RepID=A0Y7W9_9GAMM|nr:hypothetical protein GP2143_13246 [marine gamma proteobacterium HTCC2143]
MIKLLPIISLCLTLIGCSDGARQTGMPIINADEKAPISAPVVTTEEKGPPEDGKQWVTIAATQPSGPDPDRYTFDVRQKDSARAFHSPGSISQPSASVLLPSGTYVASIEAFGSEGDTKKASTEFTIDGSPPSDVSLGSIYWSFNLDDNAQGDRLLVDVKHGALATGLVSAIYSTQGGSLGSSGGGCGSMRSDAGNGLNIATGIMGAGAVFFPEVKVGFAVTNGVSTATGAGLKISGGKASGSCVQAQIDDINAQLAYQESQILELYDEINRDEQAFFYFLSDINSDLSELITISFNDTIGRLKQDFKIFMESGGFWDSTPSDIPQIWMSNGFQRAIDPIVLASCRKSETACCVNDNPGEVPLICDAVADDNDGPFDVLATSSLPDTFTEDVNHLSNSSYSSASTCLYDCYREIAESDNQYIGLLYKYYAQSLDTAVSICASPDLTVRAHCPSGATDPSNVWDPTICGETSADVGSGTCTSVPTTAAESYDIVPLFDQYNDAIGGAYLNAVSALQAAHVQEQLINWLNIHRYVAYIENGVAIKSIKNPAALPGTWYSPLVSGWCGKQGFPSTPEEHADAFNCAQTQLGLAYAQRLNILYTTTLNHMISDLAVAGQVYPSEPLEAPSEWAQWAEGKSWSIDYATEIGKALPAIFWDGSRTPIELVTRVAGRHSPSKEVGTFPTGNNTDPSPGVVWTEGSVLYQSYQIKKVDTCVRSLRRFNSDTTNSSTDIIDAVGSFEDCPSLFALSDQTPVNQGYYDGATLQPYSLTVAPGGFDCPASCGFNECASGLNNPISPEGGQGLVDGQCRGFCSDSNTCGDYRYATGNAVDCTRCGSVQVLATDWNSSNGDNGSWKDSCNNPTFSGAAGDSMAPPTLRADCLTGSGQRIESQKTCIGGRWGNDNGLLFCEAGEGDVAQPSLALSAPMPGNIALCSAKVVPTARAVDNGFGVGQEGSEKVICPGVDQTLYYGKRYVNALGVGAEKPGYGTEASFVQMISDPTTMIMETVSGRNFSCDRRYSGDIFDENVLDSFDNQCFCGVDGTQLTWYRPQDRPNAGLASLPANLSYLACGHYKAPNSPDVAVEYYSLSSDLKDEPPTQYRDELTTEQKTFESDIGVSSATTGGRGVKYEVAFANIDSQCNDAGPGEILVTMLTMDKTPGRGGKFTSEQCLFPFSDRTIKSDVGNPVFMYENQYKLETTGNERDITGEERCSGVSFKQITNRDNDTYYTYPLQIRPKNLATGEFAGGPRIPIDLLMQCSDDGALECEDQSTCMHMVTFKSAGDADEELAKRGFVCKSTKDDRSNPGERAIRAKMECELQDGRKFQIALSQEVASIGADEDGRVGVVITELDNNSGN